jgi:hypothetical protein
MKKEAKGQKQLLGIAKKKCTSEKDGPALGSVYQ